MQSPNLDGGLIDPPRDAAIAFRAIMTAMARPGTIHEADHAQPPAPLSPAAATVLLTLADPETPLFLAPDWDNDETRAWIAFHTGAPLCAAPEAAFALGPWEALLPFDQYAQGSPEYPDRSATLIAEVATLTANGTALKGPGIKSTAHLSLPQTDPFIANRRQFPLGVDVIFTSGTALAAMPRSTEVC